MNNHSPRFIEIAIDALKEGIITHRAFLKQIALRELSDDQVKEILPYLEIDANHVVLWLNKMGDLPHE